MTSATSSVQPVDTGAWRGSLVLTVLTLAGFGFLYSLAGVGIGQALFPEQARGSVITQGGRVVGSALVAQPFVGEGYFHARPSSASYDLMALAASNQARTNPELRKRIEGERAAVAQREGVAPATVPSDLVTQSGSGIDPHVSPASAALQVARVARARGLSRETVERLVAAHTEPPQFGVLGVARVNVLTLNLALDASGVAPTKP